MLSTLALTTVASGVERFAPGFGFLFFLVPLFWIGFFVLLFALLGRRMRRGGWGGPGWGGHPGANGWQHNARRSAESTLAERFAQGDIDEKEYRARLEVLRANNGSGAPAS